MQATSPLIRLINARTLTMSHSRETTDLNLLTLEPLSLLDSEDRVVLHDGKRLEIVSKDYLMGKRSY